MRREIADRIKQQVAGPDSPLRPSIPLLRIFGHAGVESLDDVELLISLWLEQGDNKDLLDANDDGSSDEAYPWLSSERDEFAAGGPHPDSDPDEAREGRPDRGDDEGDDGDEHGGLGKEDGGDEDGNEEDEHEEDEDEEDEGDGYVDEEDDNGREEHSHSDASGSNGDSSSPSSYDSNPKPNEEESSESGSEYGPESNSSSSDDDRPSTGRRGRRSLAPSPSPSLQKPSHRSPSAESSPNASKGRQPRSHPKAPSRGTTSATASRGRRSESEESHIIPPQRSVHDSDGENIEKPDENSEPGSPSGVEDGGSDSPIAPRYTLRAQARVEYFLGGLAEPGEEEENPLATPDEAVGGFDQQSARSPVDDPDDVAGGPYDDPATGVDDDSTIGNVPGDDIEEHPEYDYDKLPSDIEDPAVEGEESVAPEEDHWLTQRSDAVRRRFGTHDYRDFGTDDLDAEGRLKFGGLTRAMDWADDSEGPRKKRRRC